MSPLSISPLLLLLLISTPLLHIISHHNALSSSSSFTPPGTNLLPMTPDTLQKQLQSPIPTFVAFVAPWCGHCQRAKPELLKAAKSLGGVVHIATVDCEEHKSLAAQYGIQGFPTMKLFRDGGKTVEDYNGQRTASAIVNYAMFYFNQLSDPVKKLDSQESVASFLGSSSSSSGAAAADRLKVILLTNKDKNPTLFKSLALEFSEGNEAKKVDFAFVPEAGQYLDQLKALYGVNVDKVPAILLVKPSADDAAAAPSVEVYDGKLKKYALMEHLRAALKKISAPSATGDSSSEGPKVSPMKQQIPKVRTLETQEDLEKHCERMCMLGFLGGGVDEDTAKNNKQIFTQIAQQHNDHGFPFLIVDPKAEKSLTQQFDSAALNTNGQLNIIALRLKRKKMAKSGVIENASDAAGFLDRIAYGDVRYEKLKTLPRIEHDEL